MVRFFTQTYHRYPFKIQSRYFVKPNPACLAIVRGHIVPYFGYVRRFAKAENPKNPGSDSPLKMPEFTHPENLREEGYFKEKARQQLDELRRRMEKLSGEKPDEK